MAYKISLLINHEDGRRRFAGWSCTFYNAETSRTRALSDCDVLATAVDGLMGINSASVAVRFNELAGDGNAISAGKRVANVYRFGQQSNVSALNDAESDYPETALVLRDHAGIYSRTWWLNGVPDVRITGGGSFAPSGAYQGKITALQNILADPNGTWRLRVQDRTVAKFDILSSTAEGIVTTAQAHGYTGALYVRITGSRNSKQLNGRWKVNVLSPTTFQLTSIGSKNVLFQEGDCKVQREKLILVAYAPEDVGGPIVEIVRSGNHKVGRPFDPHSGRRTTSPRSLA